MWGIGASRLLCISGYLWAGVSHLAKCDSHGQQRLALPEGRQVPTWIPRGGGALQDESLPTKTLEFTSEETMCKCKTSSVHGWWVRELGWIFPCLLAGPGVVYSLGCPQTPPITLTALLRLGEGAVLWHLCLSSLLYPIPSCSLAPCLAQPSGWEFLQVGRGLSSHLCSWVGDFHPPAGLSTCSF